MRVEARKRSRPVACSEVRPRKPIAVDRLVLYIDGRRERLSLRHGRAAVSAACDAAMLAKVEAVAPLRARTAACCNTGTEAPRVGVRRGDGGVSSAAWRGWGTAQRTEVGKVRRVVRRPFGVRRKQRDLSGASRGKGGGVRIR